MAKHEVIQNLGNGILSQLQDSLKQLEGSPAEADLAAGKILELRGGYTSSIPLYRKCLQMEPAMHEARARLALALSRCGQNEEAIGSAKSLADDAPSFTFKTLTGFIASSFGVLGDVLSAAGETEAAVEAYKEAVNRYPDDEFSAKRLVALRISAADGSTFTDNLSGRALIGSLNLTEAGASPAPGLLGVEHSSMIVGIWR